jgi:hypothetical protein
LSTLNLEAWISAWSPVVTGRLAILVRQEGGPTADKFVRPRSACSADQYAPLITDNGVS